MGNKAGKEGQTFLVGVHLHSPKFAGMPTGHQGCRMVQGHDNHDETMVSVQPGQSGAALSFQGGVDRLASMSLRV